MKQKQQPVTVVIEYPEPTPPPEPIVTLTMGKRQAEVLRAVLGALKSGPGESTYPVYSALTESGVGGRVRAHFVDSDSRSPQKGAITPQPVVVREV